MKYAANLPLFGRPVTAADSTAGSAQFTRAQARQGWRTVSGDPDSSACTNHGPHAEEEKRAQAAFILSSNDKRRHMSNGPRAMVAAKICWFLKTRLALGKDTETGAKRPYTPTVAQKGRHPRRALKASLAGTAP